MIVFLVLNNLALTYRQGRKYKEAIKTYEESLELKMRCEDGNLVEKSTTLMNLGYCYGEIGNLEKSLNLLEEALTISRLCFSSSHPFLALTILHLSNTYNLLDRKDEAWKLAREALDIASVSLPSSHSQLAVYMIHLGNCCRSRGNCDEAISWHEKARQLLQQQEQSSGRDELVAANLYLLSRDHDEKGCYEKALKLCLEAIEMEQESHSPDHLYIAIRMMSLGSYEIKAARLEASMAHLQSSLSVLQDTLPTSHFTADCHFYLATLFLAMKEGSQGSLHVEKCLELRKTIFPVGHSKIGKAESLKQEIQVLNENASD
ncbi:kinesin light chain-like [Corticium candelabrum]|uniref:kinesin light chain-like n=1 Tax=Corticium candelabrum TaxID=121492 RepID=UPI002E266DCE|nr:kinesin light chain-like [Corticium candelabrum]